MISSLMFNHSRYLLDDKLLEFNTVIQLGLLVLPISKVPINFANINHSSNNNRYYVSYKKSNLKRYDLAKSIKFIEIVSYLAQHIINYTIFFIKKLSSRILIQDPD